MKEELMRYMTDKKNKISPEILANRTGEKLYYFGIIDTFTFFNLKKNGEFLFKRVF